MHIETIALKEIYADPIEEKPKYKVELTNQFNSDKESNELNLIYLTDFQV